MFLRRTIGYQNKSDATSNHHNEQPDYSNTFLLQSETYLCVTFPKDERCSNVRCGYNAYCYEGVCRCISGHEGDANYECKRVAADRCANVRCGYNARCIDGTCYCESGYEGDPSYECRAVQAGGYNELINATTQKR